MLFQDPVVGKTIKLNWFKQDFWTINSFDPENIEN